MFNFRCRNLVDNEKVEIIILFVPSERAQINNYWLKDFLQLIKKERGEVTKRLPPTTFCRCFSRRCAR